MTFTGSPYESYVYAYPHKTAYRPLPPRSVASVWVEEPRESLSLYVHVPFCGMRCGFCNLFTTARPERSRVRAYLAAFRREVDAARSAIPEARFARFAVGGGTPTYLEANELAELFDLIRESFGVVPERVPTSVEASPETVTAEKVSLLRELGVERVSIGVQSFLDGEVKGGGRPQRAADVAHALRLLRDANFPRLNLDLIYGLPGQTEDTFRQSLRIAMEYAPEEFFLYPLYVRPLTGLGRRNLALADDRLACYRAGRDFLLHAGYEQVSMRMFRKPAPNVPAPEFCCQTDGMLGLGCGARSYTRGLHYSSEYAVSSGGVDAILANYEARSFGNVAYGFPLNDAEQRRRFVLQSILNVEGLALDAYRRRFGTSAVEDLPQLAELVEAGYLAPAAPQRLVPTAAGLEYSDAMGPWLFSPAVRQLMREYELR